MIHSPPHPICSHYDISPRRKGVIDLAEGIESISNNALKTVAFVTVGRCDGDSRNDPVDKGFGPLDSVPGITDGTVTVTYEFTPPPVGGIAEVLVGGGEAPASTGADSGSSSLLYAAIVGGTVAAAVALAAAGWYARRRWLR